MFYLLLLGASTAAVASSADAAGLRGGLSSQIDFDAPQSTSVQLAESFLSRQLGEAVSVTSCGDVTFLDDLSNTQKPTFSAIKQANKDIAKGVYDFAQSTATIPRFGIIGYSIGAEYFLQGAQSSAQVSAAVDRMYHLGGGTKLSTGISKFLERVDTMAIDSEVMFLPVISDFLDQDQANAASLMQTAIQKLGARTVASKHVQTKVMCLVINGGYGVDPAFLSKICSDPTLIKIYPDIAGLLADIKRLIEIICSIPVPTAAPEIPSHTATPTFSKTGVPTASPTGNSTLPPDLIPLAALAPWWLLLLPGVRRKTTKAEVEKAIEELEEVIRQGEAGTPATTTLEETRMEQPNKLRQKPADEDKERLAGTALQDSSLFTSWHVKEVGKQSTWEDVKGASEPVQMRGKPPIPPEPVPPKVEEEEAGEPEREYLASLVVVTLAQLAIQAITETEKVNGRQKTLRNVEFDLKKAFVKAKEKAAELKERCSKKPSEEQEAADTVTKTTAESALPKPRSGHKPFKSGPN